MREFWEKERSFAWSPILARSLALASLHACAKRRIEMSVVRSTSSSR